MHHERVVDGAHVLRLGRHMVDMFHRSRVVKNTNLQHKGEKKTVILRKEKVDYNSCNKNKKIKR